jgi:DNA-binding response OmpR family regulator
MRRILLIDDSVETQYVVEKSLSDLCALIMAPTGSKARELLRTERFDLILLDVVLPDEDGFQLCAFLMNDERTRELPIIFLTGASEVSQRVMGITLGAEDYIAKPFAPAELRARVMARLRKVESGQVKRECVRLGEFLFDLSSQKASFRGEGGDHLLQLTPIEFRLLFHFARHAGVIFTRDQLMTAVWGENIHCIDRTVDVHVSKLRKKIAPSACALRAAHGVGYSLVPKAEVERRAA